MSVIRNTSILTNQPTLETLHNFPSFPIYAGCTTDNQDNDKLLDLCVDICTKTGILQLKNLPSMEDIYLFPHSDAIGSTWEEHNELFLKFIEKFNPKKTLEIGGGSGKLATKFIERNPHSEWTIIDPNPLFQDQSKLHNIKEYFSSNTHFDSDFDMIIHSHVLEHQFNPEQFLTDISKLLKYGEMHIFSFPNLGVWLIEKYLNCLNFEHTLFLTEQFTDALLKKTGFEILEKKNFRRDHSIFYATRFIGKKSDVDFPNLYNENKRLYLNFINYYENFVKQLNSKLKNYPFKVFIFGAHMFSQYLLAFGLEQSKIHGILDNSNLKIGKRLYGTNLTVFHPNIIKDEKEVAVILKVGSYRNEIIEQLKKINPNVIIYD